MNICPRRGPKYLVRERFQDQTREEDGLPPCAPWAPTDASPVLNRTCAWPRAQIFGPPCSLSSDWRACSHWVWRHRLESGPPATWCRFLAIPLHRAPAPATADRSAWLLTKDEPDVGKHSVAEGIGLESYWPGPKHHHWQLAHEALLGLEEAKVLLSFDVENSELWCPTPTTSSW